MPQPDGNAKTTAHPGFAKRLPGCSGAAGFIAAAKRRETFKTAAETGGAHAGEKPRKRGRHPVNDKDVKGKDDGGKDGGDRPEGADRGRGASKAPATRRNPHDTS